MLTNRLAQEWTGFGERERSRGSREYREAQGKLQGAVVAVGQTGAIDTLLAAERAILDNELRQYGNSAGVRQSVNAGLAELARRLVLGRALPDPGRHEAVLGLLQVNADLARLRNL